MFAWTAPGCSEGGWAASAQGGGVFVQFTPSCGPGWHPEVLAQARSPSS